MLKKLSKSRKKKPASKPATSQSRLQKEPRREQIEVKQRKISNKHNHHASTLTLLSNHNASQCSLGEDAKVAAMKKGKSKNRDSSISLLVKDPAKQKSKPAKQPKKTKKNSSVNPNSKPKKPAPKISPQKLNKPQPQNPKKPRLHNQQQLYERINLCLYKSKTNSQINFSNNSSVRDNNAVYPGPSPSPGMGQGQELVSVSVSQSRQLHRKTLTIDCSDQYILNQYFSNSRIRNTERRRLEAAVKIQKVFRGYLTRKMLQHYIEREEERLHELERQIRNSSSRHSINPDTQSHRQTHQPPSQPTPLQSMQISIKQPQPHSLPPINHEPLEQQSSIYPQQEHDSLSRYLPFNQNNSIDELEDQSEIYEDYGNKIRNQGRGLAGCGEGRDERDEREERGREVSEEYFKYTPSSSYAPKSKIEEPIPTDFSEKRVEQFESGVHQGKSKQLLQPTFLKTSQEQPFLPYEQAISLPRKVSPQPHRMLKNPRKEEENSKKEIVMLKREEKEKWGKIIQMLSHQIVEAKSKNEDNQRFMNMILDFSKRNKEELEKSSSSLFEASLAQGEQKTSPVQAGKQSEFRPIEEQPNSSWKKEKNLDLPLDKKKSPKLTLNMYNCHIPKTHSKQNYSLLQKTEQLKNFYKKNYAAYPIEQMVQIREKALEKRESEMMNRLNQDLYGCVLTHEQFISRLAEMQDKFQSQRQMINKAKMEIFMGYRATHRLMQDSVKDAWYLGFKIPFSQSLKDFKGTNQNNLWVRDLIVDQLRSFSSQNSHPKPRQVESILNESHQSEQQQQSASNMSLGREQKSEMKKHELSISLPHEDSSLTIRPSNQVSQQSLFSEEISYNEGEVEIQGLQECVGTDELIFNGDSSEDDSQQEEKPHPTPETKGFRRVDPQKLIKRNEVFSEGPLLIDPDEQEEIEKQVMRKISINQRKRPTNEPYINIEQLRKYEMTPRHSNPTRSSYPSMQPKSEIYKVDLGSESSEDQIIFNEEMDPSIKSITEEQANQLVWEAVSEIYATAGPKSKLIKGKSKAPAVISVGERKLFVDYLNKEMPKFESLLPRVNQKMMASRMELLKFMRVSFEESEDSLEDNEYSSRSGKSDDAFEQIGKFEHILPADVCISAIDKYLRQEQEKEENKLPLNEDQVIEAKVKESLGSKVSTQCLQKVVEREKVLAYNQFQKVDLRREIKKVEFHCIFDSLNEILMKRRLRTVGYSGIGLNELTMVVQKEGFKEIVEEDKFKTILNESMGELNDLISSEKSSSDKLLMQNYEKLCENDSQWIYYTDEALSFALEFVYMLEDEIFFEETTQIFKKFRHF